MAPPLDTYASSVSGEGQRRRVEARRVRYELRVGLWQWSEQERVRKCGRVRVRSDVAVMQGPAGAHFAGVVTCGSVWACPVCAAKVAERRAQELHGALVRHFAAGGSAEFLTLTLPHHAGDRLEPMRRLVAGALRAIMRGRAWVQLREALGLAGHVRALEVTHGANGWHSHAHVILLTDRRLSAVERERLRAFTFGRWRSHVTAAGYDAPLPGLCPLEPVATADVGRYVSKLGAARELTHGAQKQGRNGSRTGFQVLAGFLDTADADDLELWREYEGGMKGARQLEWSRGLKARLCVNERTDEELAAEEVGGEELTRIPATLWDAFVRRARSRRLSPAALLEAAERGGEAALWSLLLAVTGDVTPPAPLLLC